MARPIEHGGDVGFALRQGHEIGRVGEVAREGAHRFRIGLAVGVQKPFVRLLRQDACERGGRRDARRAERDVGCSRRRRDAGLDAETGGDKVEQMLALTLGEARVLEPPAVEFQPLTHGSVSLDRRTVRNGQISETTYLPVSAFKLQVAVALDLVRDKRGFGMRTDRYALADALRRRVLEGPGETDPALRQATADRAAGGPAVEGSLR